MKTYSRTRLALLARAERAVMRLYHLATPAYPADFGPYGDRFADWLGLEAADDLEYLNHGGPYGHDYRETLAHPVNSGHLKSEAARARYIRMGLDKMNRDPGAVRVVDMFGKLYTWGRGGRTVAPEKLVRQRGGGSFSLTAERLDDWSAERLTEAVQVLERFGDDVAEWNASVPERWAEHTAAVAADDLATARRHLTAARASARALLADWRRVVAAGVEAPAICRALRTRLTSERQTMNHARATLDRLEAFA